MPERQKLVSTLQLELQSTVASVPVTALLPGFEGLFFSEQLADMDVDQTEVDKHKLLTVCEEASNRRRVVPGPPRGSAPRQVKETRLS